MYYQTVSDKRIPVPQIQFIFCTLQFNWVSIVVVSKMQPKHGTKSMDVLAVELKSDVSFSDTLYQFIFTTDEKPTVVYPIPDEIPTLLSAL